MGSMKLHAKVAHVAKPSTTGMHTHTQYIIGVSDARTSNTHWTVYRRYSEFRQLKLELQAAAKSDDLCSDCECMPADEVFRKFPHRLIFGNLRESTLELRRERLNQFITAVAQYTRACQERHTCQTRSILDRFLMVNDVRFTFLDMNMDENLPNRKSGVSRTERTSSVDENDRMNKAPIDKTVRYKRKSMPDLLEYKREVETSRCDLDSIKEGAPWKLEAPLGNRSERHSAPNMTPLLEFSNFPEQRSRARKQVHRSSAAKRAQKLEEEEHVLPEAPKPKPMVPLAPIAE